MKKICSMRMIWNQSSGLREKELLLISKEEKIKSKD